MSLEAFLAKDNEKTAEQVLTGSQKTAPEESIEFILAFLKKNKHFKPYGPDKLFCYSTSADILLGKQPELFNDLLGRMHRMNKQALTFFDEDDDSPKKARRRGIITRNNAHVLAQMYRIRPDAESALEWLECLDTALEIFEDIDAPELPHLRLELGRATLTIRDDHLDIQDIDYAYTDTLEGARQLSLTGDKRNTSNGFRIAGQLAERLARVDSASAKQWEERAAYCREKSKLLKPRHRPRKSRPPEEYNLPLLRNDTIEQAASALKHATPDWDKVVDRFRELAGSQALDDREIGRWLAKLHLTSLLESIASSQGFELDPLTEPTRRGDYLFAPDQYKGICVHQNDEPLFRIDRLAIIDTTPVVFLFRPSGCYRNLRTETPYHPGQFKTQHALFYMINPKGLKRVRQAIRELLVSEKIGYIVVASREQIQKESSAVKFRKCGGILVPFYASEEEFPKDVLEVKRQYGL